MKELVENNINLVWSVVKRFSFKGHDMDDLFQTGCVGLVKAADRFDPTKGFQFSTYAVSLITGEILQFFRSDGAIKVSRALKTKSYQIKKSIEHFSIENGREPTISEIAAELTMSTAEVAEAMNAGSFVYSQNDSGKSILDNMEAEGWGSEEEMIDKLTVNEALLKLKGKERQVIVLRYICGETQEKVAKRLGLTQVKVCRIEKKIRERLVDCI